MEGRGWVGKVALGHHGLGIAYAPDPGVELEGVAAGRATARGTLFVEEDISLSGEAAGSAEGWGSLTIEGGIPPVDAGGRPGTDRTGVIHIGGTDVTAGVEFATAEFISSSRGTPGRATFRVRVPDTEYVIGQEITLDVGGRREWGGFIVSVKYGFYFPAAVESARFAVIQAVDYNVLLQKRVIYDKNTPTKTQLTTFPPDTPDDDVIRYYIRHHSDLPADGINYVVGVEHVGTPSTDDEISGAAGWTLADLLAHLRFNTGAIDYIDPDKRLIHTDVDKPNAPFGISDDPGAGEVGCRDFEIDFGAEAKRNDALIWGMGQGFTEPVFSRETAAGVTNTGTDGTGFRWQIGKVVPTIWRQATVDRIADSYVHGSPQSKRGGKDDRVAIRCTVFEPGLRVADKVPFRSVVWDYEDVVPIRELRITFPTPTSPRYDIIASHEIDDPWSTFEFWFPGFDLDIPEITIPEIDIPLPGTPIFVDEDGDPILINDKPPKCVGGRFRYISDDDEDDPQYNVRIRMFALRHTIPKGLPQPDHPSTWGYYMIDGDPGTGLMGYRAWTSDSVIWQSSQLLLVQGVEIVQGIGVDDPKRHRSTQLRVYASTREDGKDGEVVAIIDGSGTIIGGGFGPVFARYIDVHSTKAEYISRSRGDYGWGWAVNEASLFAVCKAEMEPPSPGTYIRGGETGSGADTEVLDRIDPPPGQEPGYTYIRLASVWLPGTLMIWIDGELQDPATYFENPAEMWVRLDQATILGDIYVRYIPL